MTRGKRGDRAPWACGFKAAKGRWIIRYYDAQGSRQDEYVPKEVASTAEDRTRARHYAQKWFRAYSKETKDLERGKAAPEPPKVLTLRKLSKDWLDHRKGRRDRQHIKPATYRQDKVYLNEHILPALGDVPLEQLTHLAVKKFLRKLTERKLAFNTVANILSVLRVFIDDILAEEWAQIIGNPARHPSVAKELPRRPSRTRGVAHLTIEQVCVLLKHKKTPVERKVRYLVGVCAGLRDGEVSALRFSSIAPTPGAGPTLCIQEALALDTVGRGVGFLSPKSEFSVRRIPVHPLLAELLGWWKSTGWPRWVGRPATDKALIFPNPDGKPWRPRSAELLREDLKNAGLPVTHSATGKSFEFHTLRASFSTWLAEAGVDTDDRAALMGHAPRSVTDAFYTDRTMRRLRVAIDRLVIPLTLQAIIGKPGASRETSL